MPRKPRVFGVADSHRNYRYSCRHFHFHTVHRSFRNGFIQYATLLYHASPGKPGETSVASVMDLSPDHFRRETTRLVSYYALFQGWLLLSQPPGCLCDLTSFAT